MPATSSVLARLWPARQRRRSRRTVTRPKVNLIVITNVPAGHSSCKARIRSGAWTLYSRWEWRTATARAERARRAARR